LRTQQILAHETGVPNTIDPLAGSYYVEALTDQLEREAEEIFTEVDRLGGVVPGLDMGYFQREIALSAQRQQREVESDERLIVGVNAFTEGGDDSGIDILKIGDAPEQWQRARLAELRATRDDAEVRTALDALAGAAAAGANVVDPMLDCVRAYCTLYEIRYALERVYGAYREPVFF
jgi:methylmalonyl-CoA mutase N-terminal domain/subunit